MGLDITLVKFDKVFYDSNKTEDGLVDACKIPDGGCIEIAWWRKRESIKDLLGSIAGNQFYQYTYGELSRLRLAEALRKALYQEELHGELLPKDEMELLIPTLRKVLKETDFDTETIAMYWIS